MHETIRQFIADRCHVRPDARMRAKAFIDAFHRDHSKAEWTRTRILNELAEVYSVGTADEQCYIGGISLEPLPSWQAKDGRLVLA